MPFVCGRSQCAWLTYWFLDWFCIHNPWSINKTAHEMRHNKLNEIGLKLSLSLKSIFDDGGVFCFGDPRHLPLSLLLSDQDWETWSRRVAYQQAISASHLYHKLLPVAYKVQIDLLSAFSKCDYAIPIWWICEMLKVLESSTLKIGSKCVRPV